MVTSSKTVSPARFLNPDHPIRSLSIAFWVWKSILLLTVICCPGPGYDTSTGLLAYQTPYTPDARLQQPTSHTSLPNLLKFVRWDAIYFVHTAENGYVYEQEWAFGYGYSKTLAFFTSVLHRLDGVGGVSRIALVAVVLSHIAHLLSVIALYKLSVNVFGLDNPTRKLICLLSAALHIISPAGAFLSAPYGEALFSFFNITGFYIYSSALLDYNAQRRLSGSIKLLLASVLFSAATMVRSNGVLSGFLFAYDAVLLSYRLLTDGLSKDVCLRLCVIIIGGCVVGFGMVFPQVLAYADFCMHVQTPRPWCEKMIPSIYGWVQAHYWDVGFLRYWTVSNLPLFFLALPMLYLLCRSSMWALRVASSSSSPTVDQPAASALMASFLTRLAVPQALLAILAFTSYHVQIINRISSGYPIWYWYLAYEILAGIGESHRGKHYGALAVQGMAMYALIQAILFGSFLPPA